MSETASPTFKSAEPAAVAQYRHDGVVCLRGVFERRWTELALRGIQRNLENPGPFFRDHTATGSPGRYLFDFWTWRHIPEFSALVLESPAGAIAGELLEARESTMIMDNWFLREAGATNGAPWHHDEPYFDFEGRMCVIWLPLEPVTRSEGLTFLRASHRWGKLFAIPQFSENVPFSCEGDAYSELPDIDAHADDYEFLSWDMDVGDCLVFDFRTVHSATSKDRPLDRTIHRMSLRFAAEDTLFKPRGAWTKEISDHLIAEGQQPGMALDCDLMPRVWRAGA